jgi:hypothetical protein
MEGGEAGGGAIPFTQRTFPAMRVESTPGVGLGVAGAGVGLAPYVLDGVGVKMPTWAFIVLGVIAAVMIVGGILLEVRAHRRAPTDRASGRTGIAASDEAAVRYRRGRISGQDTSIDARDKSDVEAEDTDIE